MDTKTLELVKETLSQYSATIHPESHCIVTAKGKETQIKVTTKRRRIAMVAASDGRLMFSGAISAKSIESFVESFWYWEKDAS